MKIEIVDYSKEIGKKKILTDINMVFDGGKIYGLRGVNGSGKTMLIRAIAGLIYPSKGWINVNGDRLGKNISFPDSLGVLIEAPALLPEYSAFDNLSLIASLKNIVDSKTIKQCLLNVGLDPESKLPFKQFSLGMKQKLGIAAAIFENPQLILLDEPFNALDESSVSNIKRLIYSLKCEDRIIILACHDRSILDDISDEIIEIEEGIIKCVRKKD